MTVDTGPSTVVTTPGVSNPKMELGKNFNSELSIHATLTRSDWAERLARLVSGLSSPPLMVITGIILCAQTLAQSSAWLWASIFILISVIPPLIYVIWLVHHGRVTDFHLNVRSQRTGPLLMILTNEVLVLTALIVGGAPNLLVVVAAAGLIVIAIILLLTLRWKISGHSAAAAGLVALALVLFGQDGVFLTAVMPVVAWSRIHLRRHSLFEVVAGALLGGVVFTLTLYFSNNGGW